MMSIGIFVWAFSTLSCLLCYLPPFLGLVLNLEDFSEGGVVTLIRSLASPFVQFCLVGCIGAMIPILFDFTVDSFDSSTRHLHTAKSAVWLLIIASFATNMFFFAYIIPTGDINYWASTINCNFLLTLISGLMILSAYGGHIWKLKYIALIIISLALSQIMRTFTQFESFNDSTPLKVMISVFQVISGILLIYLGLSWIRYLYKKHIKYQTITTDDMYCTLNMAVFYIMGFSVAIITYDQVEAMSLRATAEIISTHTYLLTAYSVLVTLLNGRFIRAQIALTHAKKEAHMKQMLTGYFSHEIRTPLNSLLMGLQVLKRDLPKITIDEDDFALSLVEELYGSCESVVDILDSLLLYQDLDQGGEIMMNSKKIFGVPFIQNKILKLISQARIKDIELCLTVSDEIIHGYTIRSGFFYGDEEKLGQALRTLISNAIDCTAKGRTVHVIASIHHQVCHGHSHGHEGNDSEYLFRIQVKDSGPGASKRDQGQMFDNALSFTAGVLQTREGKGLGLWISHRIMKLHKGTLSVYSEGEGLGSTFTIEIPMEFSIDPIAPAARTLRSIIRTSGEFHRDSLFAVVKAAAAVHPSVPTTATTLESYNNTNNNMNRQLSRRQHDKQPVLTDMVSGSDSFVYAFNENNKPIAEMKSDHVNALIGSGRGMGSGSATGFGLGLDEGMITNMNTMTMMKGNADSDTAGIGCTTTTTTTGIGIGTGTNGISHSRKMVQVISAGIENKDVFQRKSKSDINKRIKHKPDGPLVTISKGRVLVVDDAAMNRKMMCRLLYGHCEATVEAEDGLVAVEKMQVSLNENRPFDLVLMDYQMPNLDGPTATRQMRQMGYDGPIIGVTGNALPIHIQTFEAHGANKVLHKPLLFETLVAAVMETNQKIEQHHNHQLQLQEREQLLI